MWGGHAVLHDNRLYLALAYGHWFTYSPFAAIVFVPVAALPLAVARVGWDLVSVVALAYSCVIILKLAGYRPSRLMVAGLVAAAMALDPVYQTLFLGQINLILLALILTDVWRVSRGRDAGHRRGDSGRDQADAGHLHRVLPAGQADEGGLHSGRHVHRVRAYRVRGRARTPRRCTGSTCSHDTRRVGAPYISNQSPYGTAIRIAEGQGHIGAWWIVIPLAFAVVGLTAAAILAQKAGLAGRDRGHRHHRAARVADFLGASLGVDPARPGPAGALRAPDRRGLRVPAVRAGAVLVHAAFGRAARIRISLAADARRQLLPDRRAGVRRLHGLRTPTVPAG